MHSAPRYGASETTTHFHRRIDLARFTCTDIVRRRSGRLGCNNESANKILDHDWRGWVGFG